MQLIKNQIILFILCNLFLFSSGAYYDYKEEPTALIRINETIRSSLNDNQNRRFQIILPKVVNKDAQLIIELGPNKDVDRIDNILSDPNLHVTIKNDYENSWTSQKYGSEIISISNQYLKPNATFEINVICPKKCNYALRTQLITSITIKSGKYNSFTLNANSVTKFDFTTKSSFNRLTVNVVSSSISYFKTYLALKNPSSSNTIKNKPAFSNGYSFTISKSDSFYQTNSNYELLVENEGNKVEIIIWLSYDEGEPLEASINNVIYSIIEKDTKNCYYIPIDYYGANKDIIFSSMSFNGQAFLQIGGWSPLSSSELDKTKDNEFRFQLFRHKAIQLKAFTRDSKFGRVDGRETKNLHFCIYANSETSLSLKIYYLDDASKLQKLNVVYPGIAAEDFLPIKGLTKYNLQHFNIKRDIYIYLNIIQGSPKLYLIFEKGEPQIYDLVSFNIQMRTGLMGTSMYKGKYLAITKERNICIDSVRKCQISALIYCEGENPCLYSIYYDHEEEEISMLPRNTYDDVISEDESDYYAINIVDPSIKNIAIVLTQNTGQCTIVLEEFKNKDGFHDLKEMKEANNISPDLIVLSASALNVPNLVGSITFKVLGLVYSSYSVYYYPFDKDNKEKLDHNTVSNTLKKGEILHDVFLDNQRYKVYYFDNRIVNGNKTNLYLTLVQTTKINVELFIFKSLSDFYIEKNTVKGFLYSGRINDYIYIEKTDKKNIENDNFYIMIYKKTEDNIFQVKNTYTDFYLGITDDEYPYTLNDGIEFRHTLVKNTHQSQKFSFNYLQKQYQELKVSFNVLYGNIKARVRNVGEDLYAGIEIRGESALVPIPQKHDCLKDRESDKCTVEVEVYMDEEYKYRYSAEFIIAFQSTSDVPMQLLPDVVTKRQILSGEEQYFIIDANTNAVFTKINVFFNLGVGEIYARRLLSTETISSDFFPNKNNYEYKSQKSLSRVYTIEIPAADIKSNGGRKILLTVVGVSPDYNSLRIEYTISLSNTIKEIDVDKNYRLFAGTGEISIFHFQVEDNKERLYISMTNKDKDAVMYLNYGPVVPNSISNYNWKSIGIYNEFLDISINDPFFVEKGVDNLDGDYYLTIQSLGECFYNLYISTEDIKIMTINEGQQAGCECEKENDSCYFRFESNNNINNLRMKDKDLFFYSDFTYGSGELYAKIYNNSNFDEIAKNLPRKSSFDFASNYNYLKVFLSNGDPRLTKDSVIIVGVICKEKSIFDLNVVEKTDANDLTRNQNKNVILYEKRDNFFYLSEYIGEGMTFYHYIRKKSDLNFQVRVLYSSAEFHTYINNTDYKSRKENKNFYHHISDFSLSFRDDKNSYISNVPSDYGYNNYFYFNVKPKGECLFVINLNYLDEMRELQYNKEVKGTIESKGYIAYFDFLYELDEVILTVNSLDPDNTLSVYIKKNLILQTHISNRYSMPSDKNFDQRGKTNEMTHSLSLRIKNSPKDVRDKNNLLRVLILIESRVSYRQKSLSLQISPVIGNINRIKPKQKYSYFSSVEYKNNTPTYSSFELLKKNSEDDLMIIELSSCKGDYKYVLSEKPYLTGNDITQLNAIKDSKIVEVNGKQVIVAKNIPESGFYLTVFPATKQNYLPRGKPNLVEFLMTYYTTDQNEFTQTVTDDMLHIESLSNSKIKIVMPIPLKKNVYGEEDTMDDLDYTVIISDNSYERDHMSSICYLKKLYESNVNKTKLYRNLKIEFNQKENSLLVKGLESRKIYYVNVLVTNLNTGETFTYRPGTVEMLGVYSSFKSAIVIFLIILCVIFSCIAFTFYRKYRLNKMTINYGIEEGNQENSGKVTNINLNAIKKKYNSLNEDNN